MAAFNTFSILKPMMKENYSGPAKKVKKKGFKAPPSMPKSAIPEAKKAKG